MPEYDNIVPQNVGELEPSGLIMVRRKKIVPSAHEGLFHIENGELVAFTDLRPAFEWATKDAESMHEFIFPLAGASLAGSLNYDPEKSAEVVMLTSGNRTGISPKQKESEYFVYTDNRTFFHLIFKPEEKQKTLFREDSVFLDLAPGRPTPMLHFTFNSGERNFEDLAVGMTQVLKRITKITDKLLNGYYDNP